MSFKSVLQIDGEEVNVLNCHYSFTQSIDHNGKPAARPIGGLVTVTLESDGSTDLFEWMISNTKTKSGKIIFYRRDALSKMKELAFEDAYCIEYHESFTSRGELPMEIQLTLSARQLKLGGATFDNPWPTTA
jgi:type VI protein secretion system component Hcp